jgi:hypothetical protein
MSLGARDADAFEFANRRIFGEAFGDRFLVALDLEMQTRRLTIRLVGTSGVEPVGILAPRPTHVSTLTFFGVADLAIVQGTEGGAFPQSARVDALSLNYDDEADIGHVHIAGTRGWTLDFAFDGMAIEETPGSIASLVDDDE